MSARSFRSVFMVASCAGAALGCYLVSLRVASERASLEDVESQIVLSQRDIRLLQTEIGTRGRLAQLERWNASALALSAPSADQFLKGSFELAKLAQPEHKFDFQAPVVLASAPAPERKAAPIGEQATDDSGTISADTATLASRDLLHEASLKTETREAPAKDAATLPRAVDLKSTDRPVTAAKPAKKDSVDKPGLAAAKTEDKKTVDKLAATQSKPVTKLARVAKTDPLAPLEDKPARKTTKDSGAAQ